MEETYLNVTKWEEPIWRTAILWDSDYTTFRKKQNYRDNKKISGYKGLVVDE